MVSFLQKNAAKIVIISGAALISTISGGGCDDAECTQDSTLSAKCSAGTDAQKKKCTDIANKAVSTIVLCKGKTCEDSEFASSGRCCIDASTTTKPVAPPTCATDGLKEANKKCSLAACPTATPYRVKIATGTTGCLAECATPSDTVRQTKECACLTKDANKKVTAQALCAANHLCKVDGTVELPTCAFTDKKYNSNCTYGTGTNKKTCNDYSDGNHCTGTIIGADEIAVTASALCTGLTLQAAKKDEQIAANDGAKMKICTSGQVCKIDSGTSAATCAVVSSTATEISACAQPAANAIISNCKYGANNDQYCGKRHGNNYTFQFAAKACRPKCANGVNKVACVCIKTSDNTQADCEPDKTCTESTGQCTTAAR